VTPLWYREKPLLRVPTTSPRRPDATASEIAEADYVIVDGVVVKHRYPLSGTTLVFEPARIFHREERS
jgi:hypothetical protein